MWTADHVKKTLPVRSAEAHKGTFGTALLAVGSPFMPGAAILAGMSCLRSGAGKLEIGADESVFPHVSAHLPEATYVPEFSEKMMRGDIDLSSYRVLTCGSGREPGPETEKIIDRFLQTDIPVVLDAGALSKRTYAVRNAPVILTPHPGEFERISSIELEGSKEARIQAAEEMAQTFGVTIVLKGKETVISFPDGETRINPTGNSALAKGGTGDVLTGMISGMLCCHKDWKHAVLNAVYLHGACADEWIKTKSSHTMLASEITKLLPEVWKAHE
ncbi:NAD(P)H-hydrate dehydratase [Jeotgalibacillus sp. R-1-5s-1]|uniref:NAD(P)H-hydrate dehydratase n=1 Tax=Jeotgalibacillus sp. R-1-5s-1 TaxID=2555897 RepID=UPI00106AE7C0|nr:NAD(P)H-hydrate dehydratase [Jeotgalibacillus sp. R-1-5s-1]TFE01349.1 NAD(P)H-hydrate dehydratase [Jeotgalibacillus sp. R-1-5s-1]